MATYYPPVVTHLKFTCKEEEVAQKINESLNKYSGYKITYFSMYPNGRLFAEPGEDQNWLVLIALAVDAMGGGPR